VSPLSPHFTRTHLVCRGRGPGLAPPRCVTVPGALASRAETTFAKHRASHGGTAFVVVDAGSAEPTAFASTHRLQPPGDRPHQPVKGSGLHPPQRWRRVEPDARRRACPVRRRLLRVKPLRLTTEQTIRSFYPIPPPEAALASRWPPSNFLWEPGRPGQTRVRVSRTRAVMLEVGEAVDRR